jgi:hypothetical protein
MKTSQINLSLLIILISNSVFAQINFEKSDKLLTTSHFYAVQIADMNNDSMDDVLGATSYWWDSSDEDAKIFIYLQDTLGNLHKEVVLEYPKQYPGLKSMAIGDMDNNYLKDIIIAYSDSIGISYQTDKNIFSDFKSYYCARDVDQVLCKDINNDSLADILVKNNYYYSFLNVFYQTETGLDEHTLSNTKPYAYNLLDLGDFNKDDLPDIVHHYTYYNPDTNVFIMMNAPTDGFAKEDTSLTYSANGEDKVLSDLRAVDYNSDGYPDVLGLDAFNKSVYLWPNTGDGFKDMIKIKTDEYASKIGAIDLNCDCVNEIFSVGDIFLSTHESNDSFKEYRTYHVPDQYSSPTNWYNQFSIGDLNNDSKPDFALAFLDGIVIMENISKPVKFSSIDTISIADTIIIQQGTYSYKIEQRTIIDTFHIAIVYQVDSINIIGNYIDEDVKLDTVFIRKGVFCKKSYIDTLITDPIHDYISEYIFDSTLFYRSFDTVAITSTADYGKNTELTIFPNPANDCINIALPPQTNYRNIDLEILSLEGKVLFKRTKIKTNGIIFSVNINYFKNGVYVVKINSGGKSFTGKIIKK